MSDYRCPWCGEEIRDPDYWECSPESAYPVECSNCDREFEVSYYIDPVFSVTVPEELAPCEEGCDMWDGISDCCIYGTVQNSKGEARRALYGLEPRKPMDGCPLGHDREEA